MKLKAPGGVRDFYFRGDSSDTRVIKQIFGDKLYDISQLRRFDEIIRFAVRAGASGKRPLIVDAGANIGASALYFSTRFPNARTIAIEPELGNYQLLVENTKGLDVRASRRALAAVNGRLRVVDVGEGFWGFQTRSADEGETGSVRTMTMNEIYAANAAECFPFIAKIDIEGGEKDVFSANIEWVKQTPLIMVELHDWLLPQDGTSLPFLQCIAGLDRDFVTIGEDVYSIANNLESLVAGIPAGGARKGAEGIHMSVQEPASGPWMGQENGGGQDAPASSNVTPAMDPDDPDEAVAEAIKSFQAEIEILHQEDGLVVADPNDALKAARAALKSERQALAVEREKYRDLKASEQQLRNHIAALLDRGRALTAELAVARQGEGALLAVEEQMRVRFADELAATRQQLAALNQSELVFAALKVGGFLNRRAPLVLRIGRGVMRRSWRLYRRIRGA
jgi:FkbM family methyltransferase